LPRREWRAIKAQRHFVSLAGSGGRQGGKLSGRAAALYWRQYFAAAVKLPANIRQIL